jgi:hypothetical protein
MLTDISPISAGGKIPVMQRIGEALSPLLTEIGNSLLGRHGIPEGEPDDDDHVDDQTIIAVALLCAAYF